MTTSHLPVRKHVEPSSSSAPDLVSSPALPESFLSQLRLARRRTLTVGVLAVLTGVLSLLLMLFLAASGRGASLSLLKLIFLGGGAVSVGIGLGLAAFSGGARSAGSVWFVAWGVLNLLAGLAGALTNDAVLGVFALVAGTAHCLYAALIASADIVFVCDYLGGDLSEERIRGALPLAAASDAIEIVDLVSPALRSQPPGR